MPDKKLTDNEIVKALEECIELRFDDTVGDTEYATVRLDTLTNSLDLINRLQAEIEKWQGGYMTQKQEIANLEIELKAMRGAANSYKAEIERLTKENAILSQNADTAFQDGLNEAQDLYAEQVKTEIKAEAYKEFAEKVSNIAVQYYSQIQNLLKELVGEDNESKNKS